MNFRVAEVVTTIMDKSLETLAFLGRFPIYTGPTPPLTPQTMLDVCIQNFFRVSTLYRVGGGRTARKFRFERELRNNRKIGILQYCPKDFCPGLYLYYLILEKNGLGTTPQFYCTSLHTC